jgi:hypothetical protein
VKTSSDQKARTPGRLVLVLSLLCVFVILCLGLGYYVGDLAKFQAAISAKESQTALSSVNDPQQLGQALERYPSNRFLKMVALANRDWIDIDAAARTLSHEMEPRDFSKLDDLGASSRDDLDALRRDLKTAESNAAAAAPRYIALIKDERAILENDARSLNVDGGTISEFMATIDEQHAEMIKLTSEIMAARAAYYDAYEKCVALLVREYGIYKVTDGQFIFPFPSTANSYNRAAAAMAVAAKRIAELEDERTNLRQSQLNKWKSFVDRQVTGKRPA